MIHQLIGSQVFAQVEVYNNSKKEIAEEEKLNYSTLSIYKFN